MVEAVLYVLAVVALIIGSITDFKKREVPDWVSYGLIFAALGIRLLFSIFNKEFTTILNGVIGFVIFFAIASALYYLKQWGGGDAKTFMGIGAVLGIDLTNPLSSIIVILFVLLLIFIGAIYGIIYSALLAINNKSKFKKAFKENLKDFNILAKFSAVVLIIGILSLILVTIQQLALLIFGVSIIFFLGIYSFIFTKSVEDSCLFQKVKAKQLTEGDWVAETLKIKGKTIITEDNLGITKEQINKLKNYKKLILIKIGIPFIPVFLLAFIVFVLSKGWLLGIIG